MTTQGWALLGATVCAIWLLAALYRSMVLKLASGLTRARERRTLQLEGSAAIALAFVVSAVVSTLFSFHPLLLPMVVSIFPVVVTPGIGLAYITILIERVLAWIVRHLHV